MSEIKYKRILLKLSGEALAGEKGFGLDYSVMRTVCKSIRDCTALGVQVGIVAVSYTHLTLPTTSRV